VIAPGTATRSSSCARQGRRTRRGSSASCRKHASRFFDAETPSTSPAEHPIAPSLLPSRATTTYNPALGARFLTRDPLEAITRSAYGYVNNNPLNLIDPMGLAPCACGEEDGAGGLFDFITDHKVGIIKGASWVLAGGAIIAAPLTAGGSLSTLPVWLAAGSGATAVTAEALDPKPDRAQRVTLAAGTTILGGGVGGAFGEGGLAVGALVNDGGLLAFDIWSSNTGTSPRNELCLGGSGSW
jgi:hypothetical protein